jgi:phosphate/sulfate permease
VGRAAVAQNPTMSTGLVVAIGMALAFAFTNGVHDAANAIATLVATRAARPGSAVALAAVGNVLGRCFWAQRWRTPSPASSPFRRTT